MFFAKVGGKRSEEKKEMLMIFGPIHARRGAEMKVMSTVEYKKPGTYTTGKHGTDDYALNLSKRLPGDRAPDDWDVDWMPQPGWMRCLETGRASTLPSCRRTR